jgi:large subunit ribosomal protein L18
MALTKKERRDKIRRRSRDIVAGTAERPRLCVFRSNKQFYAQLIDDLSGKTLAACASVKNEKAQKIAKIEQAALMGKEMAQKALDAGITSVVFDRSGYLYHGRVKHFADAAREAGLKF